MQLEGDARTWRYLDSGAAAGAWNMAMDEALAHSAAADGLPVLRFYRWEPACLSLGRNQPARDRYDLAKLAELGIDVVRRPTGGRAVLHRRELTYSAAVPEGLLGSPRQAYAAINRALVAGLTRLGAAVSLQPASAARAPAPSLSPCFAQPVEGEVVAGGRKLVGSAQRRLPGVLLQHGSLPLHDDQSLVASLLREGFAAEAAEAPATLSALLGREVGWDELTAALARGWSEALGAELHPGGITPAEEDRAQLAAERYAGAAWTWHQ